MRMSIVRLFTMSENKKIEVGSVVTLKSGGPEMTVAELNGVSTTCAWFARHEGLVPKSVQYGDRYVAVFPVDTLSLVS